MDRHDRHQQFNDSLRNRSDSRRIPQFRWRTHLARYQHWAHQSHNGSERPGNYRSHESTNALRGKRRSRRRLQELGWRRSLVRSELRARRVVCIRAGYGPMEPRNALCLRPERRVQDSNGRRSAKSFDSFDRYGSAIRPDECCFRVFLFGQPLGFQSHFTNILRRSLR